MIHSGGTCICVYHHPYVTFGDKWKLEQAEYSIILRNHYSLFSCGNDIVVKFNNMRRIGVHLCDLGFGNGFLDMT